MPTANANALPAFGGQAAPLTYGEAWTSLRQQLAGIQALANRIIGLIAGGPVSAQDIVNMSNSLGNANAVLTQIGALGAPLAAYAVTQDAYCAFIGAANVITGFNAIQAAASAVTNWVIANAQNYSLSGTLTVDPATGKLVVTWAAVPQSSLAPLLALLNTLSATIT